MLLLNLIQKLSLIFLSEKHAQLYVLNYDASFKLYLIFMILIAINNIPYLRLSLDIKTVFSVWVQKRITVGYNIFLLLLCLFFYIMNLGS